jgi:hypothetical protein
VISRKSPVTFEDDVFHPSPDIERALNGAEFIKWLGEQKRAREQGNSQE